METTYNPMIGAKAQFEAIERKRNAYALRLVNKSFQKLEEPKSGITIWPILVALTLGIIAGCVISKPAHAYVSEEQAIKILVGEASNQGFKGMVCVAEVLRHRNSVRGFYGLKAKHSRKEPAYVWAMARKAWIASKTSNLTLGANHFENIRAFGCPSWVKNCVETFRYKDHVFFKELV